MYRTCELPYSLFIINSGRTESEGTELMEFIGRERELARINREFKADEQRNVLIYGRRRVGKSEFIKQALST